MNLPEGVEIDPDARRLVVMGVELPVAFCMHSLASPSQTHHCGLKLREPTAATDEVAHFNVLCGENGWWVELSIFLDDATMICTRPDEPAWPIELVDALDVIVKWRDTGERTDHPIDAGVDPEGPGAYGGMEPGTWVWDRGEHFEMSPEAEAKAAEFLRETFPTMYEDAP